ncbi:MAG TPA: hypothetical protein VIQ24_15610 [Pyrinomonadaceae bacterium]
MREDFFDIIKSIDFEDYGSFRLLRAAWSEENLTLWLEVADDYRPDLNPHWKVVCTGVREESLSLGAHDDISLSRDHVLLWPHAARQTSTSFYGKGKDAHAVVGALYQRHQELAGEWLPLHRFLNPNISNLTKLIAGGFGMLAEGPEPLILAYEEVMQQYGFLTSHLEPRPSLQRAALSVLMLDDSYIVAERFKAEPF